MSTHGVRTLIHVEGISKVFAFPQLIQLMDDDIVSVIGLTLIVNPLCRRDTRHVAMHQLHFSLYLMTQCQLKLHHSATSLARTLDYVAVARKKLTVTLFTLDVLLLKLTERKIQQYIRRELAK